MNKARIPVIVGVAQFKQRKDIAVPLDPHTLMAQTTLSAIADAGAKGLPDVIDSVNMLYLTAPTLKNAPGILCETIGLKPKETFYWAVGGNTPQMLINRAARHISTGKIQGVLITGAEVHYSVNRALRKGEIFSHWPHREDPERIDGDTRNGNSDLEIKYGLNLPIYMYPLIETALRAATGLSVEEHAQRIGLLYENLSRIASENPHAWDRKAYTASEITNPTPENRYISCPYTKRMAANQHVDMSVALVMTTEQVADRLGIDRNRRVYPMSGAELHNIWFVTERPRIYESPAIREASRLALEQAGISLADIGVFDLYSCFPSAIEIARREIGIPENDSRDLSVTGGLAFFGGPFSTYSLHAICSVVERIRTDSALKAMVASTGWYNTKYSVGVYSADRPPQKWPEPDVHALQRSIDAEAVPAPVEKASGKLTIEAYTIVHDRGGRAEKGIVIGRLQSGRRALAIMEAGPDSLEKFERTELVGQTGEARHDNETGLNRIRL